MSKDGLTPTRVVNKNGVETTVHKRLNSGVGPSLSSIPKPVVNSSEDDRISLRLSMELHDATRSIPKTGTTRKKLFATLNPRTMERLVPHVRADEDAFMPIYKRMMQSSVSDKSFAMLNNFAMIMESEGYPDSARQAQVDKALAGVQFYGTRKVIADFTADNPSEHDLKDMAIAHVLLGSTNRYVRQSVNRKTYDISLTFVDSRIPAFIKAHHEHAGAILSLLNSGRPFDSELYAEIITSGGSPALFDGAL